MNESCQLRSAVRQVFDMVGARGFAGLMDQALVAGTSMGIGLVATAVLESARRVGAFLFVVQILLVTQGIFRAFVGDVMLTHVARFVGGSERRHKFQNAHATVGFFGVIVALVSAGICSVVANPYDRQLLWGFLFLPSILLQDAARYTYQTLGRQVDALKIDTCWLTVQMSVTVALLAMNRLTGGALLVAWGLGASSSVIFFYLRTGINPFLGRPMSWIRDTRHLLGWFTATGILAQATTLLIGVLVQGMLTRAAYGGLRLIQMLVLQPAQSLAMALNGLLVPRSSRLAGVGDAAGLVKQTRFMVVLASVVGCAAMAIALFAANPLLSSYRRGMYAVMAPVALPVAVQSWIYLMQVAFTVAIRGMQRGPYLLAQYAVFSVVSLAGLVLGAMNGQLLGAAWGLCAGAIVGLGIQCFAFVVCVRRLRLAKESAGSPSLTAARGLPLSGR